tara:strand:+ start:144 stop:1610 length:1467 start_codon:yes stop_codon:yes gene_type:complete
MKIIVAAGPRTGSHAFCDLQENNLSECMNIEDMLLPRLADDTIDFSICSEVFLTALNDLNFITAWFNRPKITQQHCMYTFDDNMNKIVVTEQPTLDAVINEYHRRWRIIKNMDSWCIKIIQYQGISTDILNEMLEVADRVVVLRRRDKLAQSLSMTKSTMTQIWHGTDINTDAGKIDYTIFAKSCKSVTENEEWLDTQFNTEKIEWMYYEDLDLSNSKYNKNDISLDYDLERCQNIMNTVINTLNDPKDFKSWFKNFINTTDFTTAYQNNDSEYLKSITKPGTDYWDVHIDGLEIAADMNLLNGNAKILDIGTWFGVMPYVLQQYRFKNVSTTECASHSVGQRLQDLWTDFNVDPFELHILPKKRFELPDTYDLITMFRSNVFWKTQEVLHHTPGNTVANDIWQVQDQDGVNHTFFTVYNREEWEFFIENIKEFLNPGGVAVLQPSPYVYDKIESFKEELDFLAPYCHPGPMYDAASDHRAFYIVIRK